MNNDGTVSYAYDQGVNKLSDGEFLEGTRINSLWNGKVNCKCENGDREISEMLNDDRHGPVIIFDFYGKVKIRYCSNGDEISLL